jgi:LysR family hydrogen peroxide-inducible transcriptional activator
VSQPTLSAQIAQLEAVLGVQLFERDKRRVLITPAGEAILAHARRVLVEAADLIARAAQLGDPLGATIRIGVIPTIAPYVLPEIVPPARKKLPKLKLLFREEKTSDVVAHLRDGKLDAGLLALEAEIGEKGEWAIAKIAKDDFVVALPRQHALGKKKRVAPPDIEGEHVLLLEDGHCFRDQALAVCSRHRVEESEIEATSLATLVQMVSAGSGITLLPEIAVPVENRRGQLEVRPFSSSAASRTIALIWRPASPLSPALRALASSFKETLER